jgi:8-oxo-dGTP pyrophosphatase MutT (NUDIX family)
MQKFEILKRRLLLENPWLPVEVQTVRLPNGEVTEWFVTLGQDVVIVVPVDSEGRIVLQRGYKHGSSKVITEFCAGMIDEGETPSEAARRELLEETGYTAQQLIKLGKAFPNPTGSKKYYHFFLALNAEKTETPAPEPSEQIETFLADSFEDAERRILSEPACCSVAAIAALALIRPYLGKSSET